MKNPLKSLFACKEYRLEFATFIAAIAIGAVLTAYMWTTPWAYRKTGDGLGLAVFPTIFLVGMLVCAALCIAGDLGDARRGVVPPAGDVTGVEWKATMVVGLASIVIPLAIWYVDPLVFVSVYCLFVLLIGRVRQWYLLAGSVVCLIAFIYVFMIRIADVFFPVAWLF